MPETMSEPTTAAPSARRTLRISLNSDGQRHPLLNAVAAFTLIAGVLSFVLGLVVQQHLAATILGMASFGAGLLGQLFSATREERIFLVSGIVAGFVGMGLGIAHGGFG
jgi:uncharacterized membrane protein